jgi:DNA-binding MarR family transcriptional regulator
VSLTAAGRAELARTEPDYAALVNRAMSAFTAAEIAAMTRLMVKLHDSLDELDSED